MFSILYNMYRLKKEPSIDIIENLFYKQDEGNFMETFTCVGMKILKIVAVILVIRWVYKKFFVSRENFDVSMPNSDGVTSLHDLLTADCRPEYCNVLGWTDDKTKLPNGYSLGNFSTADGCCAVPTKLLNYIYVSKGNNGTIMQEVNKDIKMDTYIRDTV